MQEQHAPYTYYLIPLVLITSGIILGLLSAALLLLGPPPSFQWTESWAMWGLPILGFASTLSGVAGLGIPKLKEYLPHWGTFLVLVTLLVFVSLSLDRQWQLYFIVLSVALYLIQGFTSDWWITLLMGLAACLLYGLAIGQSEAITPIAKQNLLIFIIMVVLNQGLIQLRAYWFTGIYPIKSEFLRSAPFLTQLDQGFMLFDERLERVLYGNSTASQLLSPRQLTLNGPPKTLMTRLGLDLGHILEQFSLQKEQFHFERLIPPGPIYDHALKVKVFGLTYMDHVYPAMILQDVSLQYQQGKSLQRTLAFNHTLLLHLPDVLWAFDPYGMIKSVHIPEYYDHLAGMSQFQGKQLRELTTQLMPDEADRQAFEKSWQQVSLQRTTQTISVACQLESQAYYIECRFISMASKDGSFCIWRDISSQQASHEALKASEQRYRSLIENMDEGLFLTDHLHEIQFVNPQLSTFLQQSEQALMGVSLNEVFPSSKEQPISFIEQITQAHPNEKFEYKLEGKAGDIQWFLIGCSPYINSQGQPDGLIGIVTDITDRKNIELQLQQKNYELDTFVYNASHDLRGPLASIIGLTNIAREETTEEKAHKYFNLINRSTKRLDGVLSDLIEVTRLNKVQVVLVALDIRSFIQEIITSLGHMPEAEKVAFKVEVSFEEPVITDKKLLTSILQNLIVNSISYQNPKADPPSIKLTVWQGAYRIHCEVKDNGMGIPERILPKIFDMFYRGNTQSKGSGLGLYIVKNALAKLGGDIQVQSEEGVGTAVTFFLPKHTEATKTKTEKTSILPPVDHK